jgi:ATP-dependent Zn protease
MSRRLINQEAIAYHEAGHAVISMKLGYKCLYVTIVSDGSRLGHACCEDPQIGGHDDKIKHALKVLIAAGLAEGRHVGSQTWGDADDRVKEQSSRCWLLTSMPSALKLLSQR